MNTWSKRFFPQELGSSSDLILATNSAEWFLYSISGLLAIVLFIGAGIRQKQGDIGGSIMSLVGAVVCASAPLLAKAFYKG